MSKNNKRNVSGNSQVRALFLNAGADAIRLMSAEIVLQPAKRGCPSKGIRPKLRKRHKDDAGMWYIHGDGKPYSMGIPGDAPEAEDTAARIARDKALAKAMGHVIPAKTTVGMIVDAEKIAVSPNENTTVKQISAIKVRQNKLDQLANYFGRDTAAEEITPLTCKEYEKWLKAQKARPGTRSKATYSAGTVRVNLAWWRKAVRRYHNDRNMPCSINVYMPPRPPARTRWCDRNDIAVIVFSALYGWYWDKQAVRTVTCQETNGQGDIVRTWTEERPGDWVTEEMSDPVTGKMIRRRKVDHRYRDPDARMRGRMLARAVLIAFYTGTRIGRLRYLTWERHLFFGWVDVKTGLLRRAGLQSGEWAGPEQKLKKATAAQLPSPIHHLFRLWEASDKAKGFKFIVHQPDGSCYGASHSITARLKKVGMRCGYDNLIMHELRHSAVTVLLLNGCTPLDVANYVGMSLEMVLKVYNHVAEQGTKNGAVSMSVKGGRDRWSPSREQEDEKPREMMTMTEVVAAYGVKKMKRETARR